MARRRPAQQPDLHPLIEEAERRGYLTIKDTRVTYHCHRDRSENWNDPEERVRAFTYSWLIIERGYLPDRIDIEVAVPRRVPNDRADIVLYSDDRCTDPYLVVENISPRPAAATKRQKIEQTFGNANSLRAPYALYDDGADSILFDVANFPQAERVRNRLGERAALPPGYGQPNQFPLIAGTASDIQPVTTAVLENKVRRAHALIWSGGKRDPLKSFEEWSKLLFAKVYDERWTPNGEPRRFQVGVGENKVQVANRIRALFGDAKHNDPTIFRQLLIDLPDDKIYEVVESMQGVGLTITDVDTLGHAFEQFFGSIFRGDLGQYFTRRELVRFIVALLEPSDRDVVLDPTCGSGGFLLETLLQVWHHIDQRYAGRGDIERLKFDFAHENLFGVEISPVLGQVCQTNLLIHKDGHTNIEVDHSALDSHFNNPKLAAPNGTVFTLVVGNPPFGDEVKEDDADHLGSNTLDSFELAKGRDSVDSELVILERSIQFLKPGGRLGMVVPDGVLNNPGEGSLCPKFRRFLMQRGKLLAVVSLPDHAFRKSGAQNKTSLLFFQKFTEAEQERFETAMETALDDAAEATGAPRDSATAEEHALKAVYSERDYYMFMAEADAIGYNPIGTTIATNDLYSIRNELPDPNDDRTILGQYFCFKQDPAEYGFRVEPRCMAIAASEVLVAHETYRLDPKFHLFKHERLEPPAGMTRWGVDQLLHRRREQIDPSEHVGREFKVLTLTQEGVLEDREAGKGRNPPAWFGEYFGDGSRWFVGHAGDLVFSQIDLWKGCVSIIPQRYDGAIFTQEFPIYEVDTEHLDPHYLKLLLRSAYFQRAIRAITTGHSNRRRTQPTDFERLELFLPEKDIQRRIGAAVARVEHELRDNQERLRVVLGRLDQAVIGMLDAEEFLRTIGEIAEA